MRGLRRPEPFSALGNLFDCAYNSARGTAPSSSHGERFRLQFGDNAVRINAGF